MCVFGSGSKGNCIFVSDGKTSLIVDAGLPIKRIERGLKALGADPGAISVLITHEHSDHIRSLDKVVKDLNATVYASEQSRRGISLAVDVDSPNFVWFTEGDFFVGDMTVTPFAVSHDVPCVGYRINCLGKQIAIVTDVGKITRSVLRGLCGCDLVVLESNHDCEMLERNKKYPVFLKKRIMSGKGHLSNADCADCVCALIPQGTKQVVLAHLSEENNCPELAFETVKRRLSESGYEEGLDVKIEVASQDSASSLFEIN